MKKFWEELQEQNEAFYPDGLDKCPPETYTIRDDNSNRFSCISCPKCPAGEEPTPPCGIKWPVKLSGKCIPCDTGTFSDEANSAACKVCTGCGSRGAVSSCTPEKDTTCKDCPLEHFEDHLTNTCKHCSSCCGRNSSAYRECITSKSCKGNCSQGSKFKRKFNFSILSRLVPKTMSSSLEASSDSSFTSLHKNRRKRTTLFDTTMNTNLQEPTQSHIIKRDINVQVAYQKDYKDSTISETKNTPPDSSMNKGLDGNKTLEDLKFEIPGVSNSFREKTDIPRVEQDKESYTSVKNVPEFIKANAVEEEAGHPVSTTRQPIVVPPIAPQTEKGQLLAPTQAPTRIPLTLNAAGTDQPQFISTSSFLGSFSGTIAAVVLLGVIGLIIYVVVRKCAHKRRRGYKTLSSTDRSEEQQHESKHDNCSYRIFSIKRPTPNKPRVYSAKFKINASRRLFEVPAFIRDGYITSRETLYPLLITCKSGLCVLIAY